MIMLSKTVLILFCTLSGLIGALAGAGAVFVAVDAAVKKINKKGRKL